MRELLVVGIPSIGKGRRVLSLDDAAASVAIIWRKPGRRHVALPALANEAGYGSHPELSDGMRAALAGVLN